MAKTSGKINEKLQKARKTYNLSYLDVAKEVGICKSYYWQIENGNRRVYYDLAIKIANVFQKKPDELFYDYYK